MARGFGSTRGVGATDEINAVLAEVDNERSFHCFFRRFGAGGGGFGRIHQLGESESLFETSATSVTYQRLFSTSGGAWTFAIPNDSDWHSVAIVYDSRATTNDPVVYVDGSSVTVTESVAPVGTALVNSAVPSRWGNRAAGDRVWNGDLARISRWAGALSAANVTALHGGTEADDLASAPTLLYYASLAGSTTTPEVGSNNSVTGTAEQADPTFAGGGSSIAAISNYYRMMRSA